MANTMEGERWEALRQRLLSPAVQVPEPQAVAEEPAKFDQKELRALIVQHVPGVEKFLFRGMRGQSSLDFLLSAYKVGLQAFHGTDLNDHLTWCLRYVVHQAEADAPDARAHLKEVAEAFMDCQAVQARTVERSALTLRGVSWDFPGLLRGLVGEYKMIALRMLAVERIRQRKAHDDENPTHYENRLTADLGDMVGANADSIRLARLDQHASNRFPTLEGDEALEAASSCRRLFDLPAVAHAVAVQVNALSAESPSESMPVQFSRWVPQNMTDKYVVLDEDTCCCTDITAHLAACVLEKVFVGQTSALAGESVRGIPVRDLLYGPIPPEAGRQEGKQGPRALLPVVFAPRWLPLWVAGVGVLAAVVFRGLGRFPPSGVLHGLLGPLLWRSPTRAVAAA